QSGSIISPFRSVEASFTAADAMSLTANTAPAAGAVTIKVIGSIPSPCSPVVVLPHYDNPAPDCTPLACTARMTAPARGLQGRLRLLRSSTKRCATPAAAIWPGG